MPVKHSLSTPKFDCALSRLQDSENGTTLSIILRVCFNFIDPDPGAGINMIKDIKGRQFEIAPWSDAASTAYVSAFKKGVEGVWNERIYILLPDPKDSAVALPRADYEEFQHKDKRIRDKYKPFIRCALEIRSAQDSSGSHVTFKIFQLNPGQPLFGAFVNAKSRSGKDLNVLTDQSIKTRDRAKELDLRHLDSSEQRAWSDMYYLPVAHEVGHLLGLEHVNAQDAACRVDKNAEICYGGSAYQARSVMGMGKAVSADEAKPWLQCISMLTNHPKGWKATHLTPVMERLLNVDGRGI